MDRSKPKREDDDEDYWRHNYPANGCWDMGCRLRHSRSTWYHNWMGRPDKRKQVLEHLRNERHGNLGIRKAEFERAEAKEREARKTKEAQDKAEHGDDNTKDGQDSSGFGGESSKSSNEPLPGVKCQLFYTLFDDTEWRVEGMLTAGNGL